MAPALAREVLISLLDYDHSRVTRWYLFVRFDPDGGGIDGCTHRLPR